MEEVGTYKRKDFISSQEPRWCSGCGDYFVFQALQTVFASLGVKKENFLVVSGIGCSSRLPYYTETYGFHTIHGRAPTVALGARMSNPDLSVWVITGDGDGMSIGGNHMIHLLRRNPNINVLLFNNEIYGLTKGQTSPTSRQDLKTKSTPWGSIDAPLNPLKMALASGATFAARVIDTNLQQMKEVFQAAHEHQGVSFVEVYTNCVIFNDGAFGPFQDRKERVDATISLKEGEPLLFGPQNEKGIILNGFTPEAVMVADVDPARLVRHNSSEENLLYAMMLAELTYPQLPIPVGILRRVARPVYEDSKEKRREAYRTKVGKRSVQSLLNSGDTWVVP